MRQTFRPLAAAAAAAAATLALAPAGAALAGPHYADACGFDMVAYFDTAQAPVGQPQPAPTPGRADIAAAHNGVAFAFASEENRARFLANPGRCVPRYDGHCACGVAKGGTVPGDPRLWRIVDDRLCLTFTRNGVGIWEEGLPGNLARAAGHWPRIEDAAAV